MCRPSSLATPYTSVICLYLLLLKQASVGFDVRLLFLYTDLIENCTVPEAVSSRAIAIMDTALNQGICHSLCVEEQTITSNQAQVSFLEIEGGREGRREGGREGGITICNLI